MVNYLNRNLFIPPTLSNTLIANTEENPISIDKIKSDWNDFLGWLDKKGVKGKPELDKGGLGNEYFNQYIKENPQTVLSKDSIPIIRKEYIALRNKGIEDIKSGKAIFENQTGKDANVDRFMKHIILNEESSDPNYIGQHLTQTPFMGSVLKEKEKIIGKSKFTTPLKGIQEQMKDLVLKATP